MNVPIENPEIDAPIFLRVFIWLLALFAGFVALHYISTYYLKAENVVTSHIEQTANAAVMSTADLLGLEPKRIELPLPQLSLIEYASLVAADENVPPILVRAVLTIENNNKPYGVSVKGAIGPMQVMPMHIKFCGLAHPGKLFDEKINIRCGIKVLKDALQATKGNIILALKYYNGGPNCIKNWCAESEQYWKDALVAIAKDKALI